MDSNRLIDTQFDRAVNIVQGLPKTGPIQTGYEEKLALYSLYKQATSGNVKTSRPGMWDMLGRAKWDAWAKQKDLSPQQAKWAYVETLQRILRKYSDAPLARELSRELASYGSDSANLVMSESYGRLSQDRTSSSEDDSDEDDDNDSPQPPYPLHNPYDDTIPRRQQLPPIESSEDEISDDERHPRYMAEQIGRPQSAVSSQHRYRTPMGMSGHLPVGQQPYSPNASPLVAHHTHIPPSQPLPRYTTPSAFSSSSPLHLAHQAPVISSSSISSPGISSTFPPSVSYPQHLAHSLQGHPYRQQQPISVPGGGPIPSTSNSSHSPSLERAVESMQTSLAALRERLEVMESAQYGSNPLIPPFQRGNSARGALAAGSPLPIQADIASFYHWDLSNMGLWSVVLVPLSRLYNQFRYLLHIVLATPNPTGSHARDRNAHVKAIVRRLALDATFIYAAGVTLKSLWKRTGLRRREVIYALKLVWAALLGRSGGGKHERVMVDRGV